MAKKKKSKEKYLRLTLVKSPIGYSARQKATIRAMGFRRMHQTIEKVDTPSMRGMLKKVAHLVQVEE